MSDGRFQKKILKDKACVAFRHEIGLTMAISFSSGLDIGCALSAWPPNSVLHSGLAIWTCDQNKMFQNQKMVLKVNWTSAVALSWVPGSSRAAPVSLIDRRWRWCCKPPRPNPPLPGAARLWSCRHVKEPLSLPPLWTRDFFGMALKGFHQGPPDDPFLNFNDTDCSFAQVNAVDPLLTLPSHSCCPGWFSGVRISWKKKVYHVSLQSVLIF